MSCPKLWYLKNYDLLQGIDPQEIEKIATDTSIKHCDKECVIYEPLDKMDNIYIVQKGEVHLYHEKDGKKFIFDTLGPGSMFGNSDIMDQEGYGHYAKGLPGLCLCVCPRADFIKLILGHEEAGIRFINHLSEKLADYQTQFRNTHEKAEEIVFSELKRLHKKRQYAFLGEWFQRPLRATHEEIAQHTGLNRVTVTKIMKKLREAGKISHDSHTGIIQINRK